MDITFIIISILFLIIGIIGSFFPGLPGPPFAYGSLLILHLFTNHKFDNQFLILWAFIVIFISIADNLVQVWGVRIFGGNKKALVGTIIGFFIGLIIPIPFGFLFGLFIGAFIGAFIETNYNYEKAFTIAAGSIAGFIASTLLKLSVSSFLVFKYIKLFYN
tara:strand:- start:1067 stop:1549 length:483 start_codon:yes stop_codon:yes gene_type:complete